MTDEPNQKPIITRDGIKKLEFERPILNPRRDYTIGGTVETRVHSCVNAEREGQITQAWKTLERAVHKLRHHQPAARLPGYAKAGFSHQTQNRASYLKAQKKAAAAVTTRPRTRNRSPSQSD